MWKEKLGNYLIDVSKYFLTGVFVASLVKDLEDVRWLIYTLSGVVAAILLLLGLILTNRKENDMGVCQLGYSDSQCRRILFLFSR